jgi:glycine/sarcosine N-methyltransferase
MSGQPAFYHLLAEFYDLLFPVTDQQQRFFADLVEEHNVRRVLDVACGSGVQAAMFRDLGLDVSALENDARMVEMVRRKGRAIAVRLGSMDDVAGLFEPGFDMAVCIGNSLPHLPNLDAVRRTVDGMHSLLDPAGLMTLSIVNFDRVEREQITAFPPKELTDPHGRPITFERFYDLSLLPERITFSTKLTVAGEEHVASTPLIPISPEWLTAEVGAARMEVLGRYAAFDRAPFAADSMSLILVARRGQPH